MLFIMTEETIKNTLTETRKQVLSAESHYEIAAKQILEQHEAEMVLFGNWIMLSGYIRCNTSHFWVNMNEKNHSLVYKTTTDLLTLFKNRNK